MFKVTHKYFRYLMRLISPNCDLYTEMYGKLIIDVITYVYLIKIHFS